MADIKAYQQAQIDPTFSESKSDGDKHTERKANNHQRHIASTRQEDVPALKKKNAVNKRKLQLFANDPSVMELQVQSIARLRRQQMIE